MAATTPSKVSIDPQCESPNEARIRDHLCKNAGNPISRLHLHPNYSRHLHSQIAVPTMTFATRSVPFSNAFTTKFRNYDGNFLREMDLSSPDFVGIWDVASICPVQTIDPRCLMKVDDIQRLEADTEVETELWGTEASESEGETGSERERERERKGTLSARPMRSSTGTARPDGMKTSRGSSTAGWCSVSSLSSDTSSDDNRSLPDAQHFSPLKTSSHPVFSTANHPFQRSYTTGVKTHPANKSPSNYSPSQKEISLPPFQDENPFPPPPFLLSSISENIAPPFQSQNVFVQRDSMRSPSDDEKRRTTRPPPKLSNLYSRREWMTSTWQNPAVINTVSQPPHNPLVPSLPLSADIDQSPPPQSQTRDSRSVGIFSPSYSEPKIHSIAQSPSPHATTTTAVPQGASDGSLSSVPSYLGQATPQIKVYDSIAMISTASPPPIPDPLLLNRVRALRQSHKTGRKRPRNPDDPPRRSKRLEIDDAEKVKEGPWTKEELRLLEQMKSGPRYSTWREMAAKLNREVQDIKEAWGAVLRERQERDHKVARITQLAAEYDRIKWGVIATVMGIEIDECISLASELELF